MCYSPVSRAPACCLPQVDEYIKSRGRLGLEEGVRGDGCLEYCAGLSGLTPRQLDSFLTRCMAKYDVKRIDPGGGGEGTKGVKVWRESRVGGCKA